MDSRRRWSWFLIHDTTFLIEHDLSRKTGAHVSGSCFGEPPRKKKTPEKVSRRCSIVKVIGA
jgi:hypothetical protein